MTPESLDRCVRCGAQTNAGRWCRPCQAKHDRPRENATISVRVDALIDRIVNNPREQVTNRDSAWQWCKRRKWVMRVGVDGPMVEFTTMVSGRLVGWALTRRGNDVADETLAERDAV